MKRDLHLVRNILLQIEATPAGKTTSKFPFEGHDDAEVAEHIALLVEAGFLQREIVNDAFGRPKQAMIRRLTWEGHEFLANAKNDTVWKKVMNQVGDKTTAISVTVLNALLAQAMKEFFGLGGP